MSKIQTNGFLHLYFDFLPKSIHGKMRKTTKVFIICILTDQKSELSKHVQNKSERHKSAMMDDDPLSLDLISN